MKIQNSITAVLMIVGTVLFAEGNLEITDTSAVAVNDSTSQLVDSLQLVEPVKDPLPAISRENPMFVDGIVAVVGDAVILHSDIEIQLQSFEEQGLKIDQASRCHVWNELLFQKLLVHRADIDSVDVTENEVDGEIERRLSFMLGQMGGSEVEFEKYFKRSVLEFKKEMRPIIKDNLKVQKMQAKISQEVEISPKEVDEYYNSIPKDSLPIIKEQYKLSQIMIKPVPSEYEKERLKKKIEDIREEILAGKDFGLMALLHSQDPGSKIKKGELGFVNRNQLVPEFSATAFRLKPGEISEVVESEYGYHIIQLIEKKGTFINVRHILLTPNIYSTDIELAKRRMDSVITAAEKGDKSFNKLASEVSQDPRTSENGGVLMNYQTGSDYFSADELDEKMFFLVQGMEKGAISKPELIQAMGGKSAYRVIKLEDKIDFHVANIESDYAQIKNSALEKKKAKEIEKWVKKNISGSYLRLPEECKVCEELKVWNMNAVKE